MELYLLRHAHAGDPAAWDGPDATRPLSEKGERQADRLGRYLSSVGFAPDAIITSPKVRAARTAELIALHLAVPVGVDDRLGGDLSLESLEALLHDAGDPAKPVLVGHDPDFSELVALLVGHSGSRCAKALSRGSMPTCRCGRPAASSAGWSRPISSSIADRGSRTYASAVGAAALAGPVVLR